MTLVLFIFLQACILQLAPALAATTGPIWNFNTATAAIGLSPSFENEGTTNEFHTSYRWNVGNYTVNATSTRSFSRVREFTFTDDDTELYSSTYLEYFAQRSTTSRSRLREFTFLDEQSEPSAEVVTGNTATSSDAEIGEPGFTVTLTETTDLVLTTEVEDIFVTRTIVIGTIPSAQTSHPGNVGIATSTVFTTTSAVERQDETTRPSTQIAAQPTHIQTVTVGASSEPTNDFGLVEVEITQTTYQDFTTAVFTENGTAHTTSFLFGARIVYMEETEQEVTRATTTTVIFPINPETTTVGVVGLPETTSILDSTNPTTVNEAQSVSEIYVGGAVNIITAGRLRALSLLIFLFAAVWI